MLFTFYFFHRPVEIYHKLYVFFGATLFLKKCSLGANKLHPAPDNETFCGEEKKRLFVR
jgi:hypothetical protein